MHRPAGVTVTVASAGVALAVVAALLFASPGVAGGGSTALGPGAQGSGAQGSGGARFRPAAASDAGRVAVGDFDGDGRADVVRTGPDGAVVWFGRADRGADRVEVFPGAGQSVVALDADGNGVDELLWYPADGGRGASLWTRSGTRRWTSEAVPVTVAPDAVAHVGDLNGDRRDDVVFHQAAAPASGGTDALLLSSGSQGWSASTFVAEGALVPLVADFDGDRRADVIWYERSSGRGVLWWGGPAIAAAPFDIGSAATLRVGRFNGDDVADLLVSGPNGTVELDGHANRAFSAEVVAPSVQPDAVVGDVNGDHRRDVISPSAGASNGPGLWNDDDSGWLWEPWTDPPAAIPVGMSGPASRTGAAWETGGDRATMADGALLAADLDGDGTEDVFRASTSAAAPTPYQSVWEWGRRREDISRFANPHVADGVVVRMLGVTAGRQTVPPLVGVVDACGAWWAVHAAIGDLVQGLLSAAAADGLGLCLNFGYRSYAEQVRLRSERCGDVGLPADHGCTYDWPSGVWPFEGGNQIQRPGYSRHQLGVAIDLGDLDGYATAPVTAWLSANAHRFGLYNLGDRHLDGPSWRWGDGGEPWHLSIDGR